MATLKLLQLTISLFLFASLIQAENPINSRKLDENSPDLENKCGDCPCDKPCNPQPPPSPPPPSPSPPPPSPPPPSNDCPPPPSKNPPCNDCQPSPVVPKPPKGPNPPYIYINGPPGSVYPVYANISGGRRCFLIGKFPFLISFVLWVLAFWRFIYFGQEKKKSKSEFFSAHMKVRTVGRRSNLHSD